MNYSIDINKKDLNGHTALIEGFFDNFKKIATKEFIIFFSGFT